jgi:hypothetical protein
MIDTAEVLLELFVADDPVAVVAVCCCVDLSVTRFFKYNFGHLFMWFDKIFGTYRDPKEFAPKPFNEGV